jgi:hypothetical protein
LKLLVVKYLPNPVQDHMRETCASVWEIHIKAVERAPTYVESRDARALKNSARERA